MESKAEAAGGDVAFEDGGDIVEEDGAGFAEFGEGMDLDMGFDVFIWPHVRTIQMHAWRGNSVFVVTH